MSHLFQKGNQAARGNSTPKKKRAERFDVIRILREKNFCPFTAAIELYHEPSTKTYAKIEILNSLQKYVAPTLKAIDLSNGNEDGGLNIVINTKRIQNPANEVGENSDDDHVQP